MLTDENFECDFFSFGVEVAIKRGRAILYLLAEGEAEVDRRWMIGKRQPAVVEVGEDEDEDEDDDETEDLEEDDDKMSAG